MKLNPKRAPSQNTFFSSLPLFLKKTGGTATFGLVVCRRMEGCKEEKYKTYFWSFLGIFKEATIFIDGDFSCPPIVFPNIELGKFKKIKEMKQLRRYRWEVIGGELIKKQSISGIQALIQKHPMNGKEFGLTPANSRKYIFDLFKMSKIMTNTMLDLKGGVFAMHNKLSPFFQGLFKVKIKGIRDKCTYDLKKKAFPQEIYKCLTCFPHDKVYGVVCYYCAKKHHRKHKLVLYGDFIVSKCDCGSMVHLKKCTKPEHILQPNYRVKHKKKFKKSVCWFCAKSEEYKEKSPSHQGWKFFECGIN